jgi:hypothetical protein
MHQQQNVLFNSFTTRIANVQNLRTFDTHPPTELKRVVENMMIPEATQISQDYRDDPRGIDYEATIKWLKERPEIPKIVKEVDAILDEGLTSHRVNDLKIHVKLESLFKDWKDEDLRHHPELSTLVADRARLIVWQAKGLCAIFAPMFLSVKERLKSLLNEKLVYVDGLTPQELNAISVNIPSEAWIFESDLEKQDRQTDDQDLNNEFAMYNFLGAHPTALSLWRKVHKNWRMKGDTIRARGDGMRMTGQATTALGNVVINMFVHSRWFARNKAQIYRVYMLGDDFIGFTKSKTNVEKLRMESRNFYNMNSKASTSQHAGTFLQMMVYRHPSGHYAFGPHFKRLRNKYEVTNGVSDITEENAIARICSYAMMIGDETLMQQVVEKHNLPVRPKLWYDPQSLLDASTHFNKCSFEEVLNDRDMLVKMMMDKTVYEHKFLVPIQSKW